MRSAFFLAVSTSIQRLFLSCPPAHRAPRHHKLNHPAAKQHAHAVRQLRLRIQKGGAFALEHAQTGDRPLPGHRLFCTLHTANCKLYTVHFTPHTVPAMRSTFSLTLSIPV